LSRSGLPNFSWNNLPKLWKKLTKFPRNYQMAIKYTKWLQKTYIFQMATKYTQIFHSKAFCNTYTKVGIFFAWKYTIWQPWFWWGWGRSKKSFVFLFHSNLIIRLCTCMVLQLAKSPVNF
jgi:hypothetical protein